MSRQFVCVVLALVAALSSGACAPATLCHGFDHRAMGTEFRLVLYAETETQAAAAAQAAFQRIDELEAVATDYRHESESRRLVMTAGVPKPVSVWLGRLVESSLALTAATGGAFDPTVGPLAREWKRALRTGEWPRQERWDRAAQGVGMANLVSLESHPAAGRPAYTVAVLREGMRLDFGGIAKGFAVDLALKELRRRGIKRALLDGGGDVAALAPPPGERGWRVEVRPFGEDPDGRVYRFLLAHGAIATSGDAYQGAILSGEPLRGVEKPASRFGHVLDPRSKLPLPSPRAALMTAPTALEADALATALLVLGESIPGVFDDGRLEPSSYESKVHRALRRGIFFPSTRGDPCVGDEFPQDGVHALGTSSVPGAR